MDAFGILNIKFETMEFEIKIQN
jgi:hypothetical protein